MMPGTMHVSLAHLPVCTVQSITDAGFLDPSSVEPAWRIL
jgi:hypothetical protein